MYIFYLKNHKGTLLNSFDLLKALKQAGYIKGDRHWLWWPNALSFEVVITAILTQNTKWANVQKAVANLTQINALSLENLANLSYETLSIAIKPSGFYKVKATRLLALTNNISQTFGDFDNFSQAVSRDWLLAQKGLGRESADAILCYACGRNEMVVDAYTYRLLKAFDFELEDYEAIKTFLMQGIKEHLDDITKLYAKHLTLNEIYARFHGKIVQYCSEHSLRKVVNIEPLKAFL